jgi:hypothetical protein
MAMRKGIGAGAAYLRAMKARRLNPPTIVLNDDMRRELEANVAAVEDIEALCDHVLNIPEILYEIDLDHDDPIAEVCQRLTRGQANLIRWLHSQPGGQAHLRDVTRFRCNITRETNPQDWRTHRMFCNRLRSVLISFGSPVQLDIRANAIHLVINA